MPLNSNKEFPGEVFGYSVIHTICVYRNKGIMFQEIDELRGHWIPVNSGQYSSNTPLF